MSHTRLTTTTKKCRYNSRNEQRQGKREGRAEPKAPGTAQEAGEQEAGEQQGACENTQATQWDAHAVVLWVDLETDNGAGSTVVVPGFPYTSADNALYECARGESSSVFWTKQLVHWLHDVEGFEATPGAKLRVDLTLLYSKGAFTFSCSPCN